MGNHNDAPRCQHLHDSGMRCGSPALRGQSFCYHHRLLRQPQSAPGQPGYNVPLLEGRSSIQLFVRQVLQSFHDGHLDASQARLYLYGIQLAAPYCTFHGVIESQMVTEVPAAMETPALLAHAPIPSLGTGNDIQSPAATEIPSTQPPAPEPADEATCEANDNAPLSPPADTPPSSDATATPPAKPPQSALLSPEEHARLSAIIKQPIDSTEVRNALQRILAHNRELQRQRAG